MKLKKYLVLVLLLLLGFLLRTYFIDKAMPGDLFAYEEWGEKLVKFGFENYYFRKDWLYTYPVYFPLANLTFGGAFWLFEHRYLLAQLHNLIRIPPASFIVFFYKYGYIFLLKLIAILSDLAIGLTIYKVLMLLTKNKKKALLGFIIYLVNPITVFLSGIWGQTDSFVGLFGLLSFIFLYFGKAWLSLPLLFISFYIKPSWIIFLPFFAYLLYLKRPKLRDIGIGVIISFIIYLISTYPFSGADLFYFTKKITMERLSLPTGAAGRASVSAFNFFTIFFKIDRDLANSRFLGVPVNILSAVSFLILNFFAFLNLKRKKGELLAILEGLFIIGFGSFLFLTNMLERYFFPALAPMIILSVYNFRLFRKLLFVQVILFANIIWSFYRRSSDEIDHPFTNNNFLLIRVLSTMNVAAFVLIVRKLRVFRATIK